ncbi:hypothetical protein MG293_001036 [Ovis ammon polii]|uniref:Uncharacterized protein n=1 Tax=Ovis ammon polii TaxID=230172 RepID=A0AAD4UMC8_OVIAM|nr:hypothetical protein MG293_001036 [Ovis ammon polii]
MALDFFSLESNEVSSNELCDVSGFGVTLDSLYIGAQGCVPLLLENLCGPSNSGDEVFGEHVRCDLSPPLSLLLGFLGVQPVHLFRWMLTVQNPKKS